MRQLRAAVGGVGPSSPTSNFTNCYRPVIAQIHTPRKLALNLMPNPRIQGPSD